MSFIDRLKVSEILIFEKIKLRKRENMDKILVSGSRGFLGRHLMKLLHNENNKVLALTSSTEHIETINNLQWMKNDDFFNEQLMDTYPTAINLAYVRGTDEATLKYNLEFSIRMFQRMREIGVKRIINISSQSVYDKKRKRAAVESDMVDPSDLYDVGKYYLENWLQDFGRLHSIDIINLRIGSLVGNGFNQRITNKLIHQALENKHFKIFTGSSIFSYVYVEDVARAIISCLKIQDKNFWNDTYNIGHDEHYSIAKIGKEIERQFKQRGQKIEVDIVEKTSDVYTCNWIDSTKFSKWTGWKARKSLEEIISSEIEFQLNEGWL